MVKKTALTFTVLAGYDCPNICKGCIAAMTPDYGFGKRIKPDWQRFDQAVRKAIYNEAETVLFSSKREAASDPGLVTQYLHHISLQKRELKSPALNKIEMQTEGSLLASGGPYDGFLEAWRESGLGRIAISIYHYEPTKNNELFQPKSGEFYDLPKFVEKLRDIGYFIRLSCCMYDGYIDSPKEVQKVIEFTKNTGADQLTLRTADVPPNARDKKVAKFVRKHRLNEKGKKHKSIKEFLDSEFTLIDTLPHGSPLYSAETKPGEPNLQIAFTTGLDPEEREEQTSGDLELEIKNELRELIWFPPNILSSSWSHVINLL